MVTSSGYAFKIESGSQSGWLIELPAMTFELGRGIPPTNSDRRIEIGEPTISRVQAYMFWYPEHDAFVIVHEPKATNPTIVNRNVIKEHALRPHDVIHMGDMKILFALASEVFPNTQKNVGFGPKVPSTHDLAGHIPADAVEAVAEAARRLAEEKPSPYALRVIRGHHVDVGRIIQLPARVLQPGNPVLFGGVGGRQNDITFVDPTVVHDVGRFETYDGRLCVVPESVNQVVLLRGMPLQTPTAVVGQEVLAMGDTVVQIEVTDGSVGVADAFLEFVETLADPKPSPFPLTRQATTIGRVNPCDLVIDDPAISRLHVSIVRRDGAHVLKHQSATNETMVNGHVVRGEHRLEHEDEIRISDRTVLRYVVPLV